MTHSQGNQDTLPLLDLVRTCSGRYGRMSTMSLQWKEDQHAPQVRSWKLATRDELIAISSTATQWRYSPSRRNLATNDPNDVTGNDGLTIAAQRTDQTMSSLFHLHKSWWWRLGSNPSHGGKCSNGGTMSLTTGSYTAMSMVESSDKSAAL